MDNLQMFRTDLWETPIWQYYISDDVINFNQVVIDVYEIKKRDEGRIISNRGGWQSNFINSQNTELFKLMQHIKNNIELCYVQLQVRKEYVGQKFTYWININSPDHFNVKHSHGGAIISGCVYLKVPKNSGDIVFYPNISEDYFFETYTKFSSDFASRETTFVAEEKKVILFPSFLQHSVCKNESHEDRISVAFNIT
jgi:uncharacterized protein (TIGR02466 family)